MSHCKVFECNDHVKGEKSPFSADMPRSSPERTFLGIYSYFQRLCFAHTWRGCSPYPGASESCDRYCGFCRKATSAGLWSQRQPIKRRRGLTPCYASPSGSRAKARPIWPLLDIESESSSWSTWQDPKGPPTPRWVFQTALMATFSSKVYTSRLGLWLPSLKLIFH